MTTTPTIHPAPAAPHTDATACRSSIEAVLRALLPEIRDRPGRGRPRLIPAAVLWSAMLVCIVRGDGSIRGIWRLLAAVGFWHWTRRDLSDDAVYHRLERDGPTAMQGVFEDVTARLWDAGPQETGLAPFATAIVAIDESTLDQMVRKGRQRGKAKDDPTLLPGKVSVVFDVRRQKYWKVRLHDDVAENEKVPARELLTGLPPGTLILADLGYFGFKWFDDLTTAGHFWIARVRDKTSTEELHRFWGTDEEGEALVWLGKHNADKAKYAVRLIAVKYGETTHSYLTNVTEPEQLPVQAVVEIYARRWDVELAFTLLKEQLGLQTIWSTKWPVIQTQVWAMLLLSQIATHLRLLTAAAVGVTVFDVSLPLLLQVVPELVAQGEDPIAVLTQAKYTGGVIRPSRRKRYSCPVPPPMVPIPPGLVRERTPRYANKTKKRTTTPSTTRPVISKAPPYLVAA
jgi:hypothetical protein